MPIISGGSVIDSDGILQNAIRLAGAPAANYGAGRVLVGSVYQNLTTGVLYVCTATNGTTTATWTLLGPGAGP